MNETKLKDIHSPSILRKLNRKELPSIAHQLRAYIIEVLSEKEGHLGASLGAVELALLLHYVFDTPEDKLVWDVGHQAYAHKIITGRYEAFKKNREFKGISGFPKRAESPYDVFGTGHSSTSISAVMGMALSAKINNNFGRHHIAVIGDASIASGMAFEGLNHAGATDVNLLVVLNDNSMGIDPSVGALKAYLTKAKIGFKPKSNNIIEALNFKYFGPIDGHDTEQLYNTLMTLKEVKGPKFLHVITTKGKGFKLAEQDQIKYHAPGKFDLQTGKILSNKQKHIPPKFQDVFGHTLVELAEINKNIVGITPAMPTGSSMKYMIEAYPDRAYDVGIAEQHAVTLAAGMACDGLIPFCNIYSTFIQRAYDQVIHDVALQNLPVVFCLDRAGIVGQDGPTHHGVFDISFLRCIPNMTIVSPKDASELRNIMYTAQKELNGPLAIRYPRGRCTQIEWQSDFENISNNKSNCLIKGTKIALLTTGIYSDKLLDYLNENSHLKDIFSLYHFLYIKPLDEARLEMIFEHYDEVYTIEDHVLKGGFGSGILEFATLKKHQHKIIKMFGLPDEFIDHGPKETLWNMHQLNPEQIILSIIKNQ